MRQSLFTILTNEPLTQQVWRMTLKGDTTDISCPGQFVNIQLKKLFLRRPISVCRVQDDVLTLVYKVVGHGTDTMRRMQAGETLDLLTGLGKGYDITKAGTKPLLIGGGVGVPPLLWLAEQLNGHCQVVLGFNTAEEIILANDFRSLGCDVVITTADGSYGVKGFVTDALPTDYTFYYACGPMPMLKAVMRQATTVGQVSLEERMGCGWGVCVGCSVETTSGFKKVCHDGPVFNSREMRQ